MVMIYQVLGFIGLLSLPILVGTLYLQSKIILIFYASDQKRRTLVDKRSSIVNELVVGMKHIKFNASEKILMDKVEKIRKEEVGYIETIVRCLGTNQAILLLQVPLSCLVCLFVYWLTKKTVDLTTVYTFTLYVTSVKTPLYFIEWSLQYGSSMIVSLKRIMIVYNLIEDYEVPEIRRDVDEGCLEMLEASLSWEDPRYEQIATLLTNLEGEKKFLEENQEDGRQNLIESGDVKSIRGVNISLRNLNFYLGSGNLCYVIGKVGSGKSSLISAFLDVMNKIEGEVLSIGSIAYIPQEAFLINDTLKNNILFGKDNDEEKYYRTLDVCQLGPDLEMLPAGDLTEIGERGINLSGGQKQRVAIARAVYSDSDIYLIDDCLGALDAEVGKAVLQKVILGVLKDKTRLVVTHFYYHFKDTDRVILMKKGEIEIDSSFRKVKGTKEFSDYAKELEENKQTLEKEKKIQEKIISSQRSLSSGSRTESQTSQVNRLKLLLEQKEKNVLQGRLLKKEGRKMGEISLRPYWFYFKNGTLSKFSTFIFLLTVSGLLLISVNLFIGLLADGAKIPLTSKELKNKITRFVLLFFAVILLVFFLFSSATKPSR